MKRAMTSTEKQMEDGELCLNSIQCKSKCCQHDSALGLARCIHKASENSGCSPKTIYGIYYLCPCERGLVCEADKSIIGTITNTNHGICQDPGSKQ
ncbi:colipase isoform X2 [Fukomys damarensis]|uniref:colipase isoform X2 n=1 Tax=Fukomys damarensis TaxID=885580 RepID=UPI00053F8271|nr:colipase isoform X2 [Fukomys damarensis]